VHDPAVLRKRGPDWEAVASVGGRYEMAYRIRHYITRSEEEWIEQRTGRADVSTKQYAADAFAAYNELRKSSREASVRRLLAAGFTPQSVPGRGSVEDAERRVLSERGRERRRPDETELNAGTEDGVEMSEPVVPAEEPRSGES